MGNVTMGEIRGRSRKNTWKVVALCCAAIAMGSTTKVVLDATRSHEQAAEARAALASRHVSMQQRREAQGILHRETVLNLRALVASRDICPDALTQANAILANVERELPR